MLNNNGASEVLIFSDSVPDGYVAGRLKQMYEDI